MAKIDGFKIGFDINTGRTDQKLRLLSESLEKLSRRLKTTSDRVHALYGGLNLLSNLLPGVITKMDLLGGRLTEGFKMAGMEVKEFNKQLEKMPILEQRAMAGGGGHRGGHFGRHITRELSSETGMSGKLGIGAIGAYAGGAAGLAAAAIGYMAYKGFENYGTVSQTVARMNMSGFGKNVGTQAFAAAQAHPMAGISYQAYLAAYNDAMSVMKGLNPQKTAGVLAPAIAKMAFTNRMIFAREGRSFTDNDQLSLVKAAELMAHSSNPNKMKVALGRVEQAYGAEQGTLPAYQLRDFARHYAAYLPYLSQKSLLELLPTMQAMGGAQLGSGLTTLQSRIMRGQAMRTGRRAEAFMASMGVLMPDGSGRLIGSKLSQTDPISWLMKDIVPKLEAHGYKTHKDLNRAFTRMFAGRIPAMLTQLLENYGRGLRTVQQAKGISTINQGYQTSLQTPFGASAKLSAAWERFTVSLGKLSSPLIIAALNGLTHFLNFLTYDLPIALKNIGAGIKNFVDGIMVPFLNRHGALINKMNTRATAFNKNTIGRVANLYGFSPLVNYILPTAHTGQIPPHSSQAQPVIHNHIHIDGKHVASQVTKHIVSAANKPQAQANSTLGHQVYQPTGNNMALGAFVGGF